MDSSFKSPVGKEIAAISAKQRVTVDRYLTDSRPIPHRQSTDTLATVARNISAEVSAECRPTYRPIVSTDGLLTKTTCRPTLGRHIGRVSVDISAECRSPYRPIVLTDTRPTDALSTHGQQKYNLTFPTPKALYFLLFFPQISRLFLVENEGT